MQWCHYVIMMGKLYASLKLTNHKPSCGTGYKSPKQYSPHYTIWPCFLLKKLFSLIYTFKLQHNRSRRKKKVKTKPKWTHNLAIMSNRHWITPWKRSIYGWIGYLGFWSITHHLKMNSPFVLTVVSSFCASIWFFFFFYFRWIGYLDFWSITSTDEIEFGFNFVSKEIVLIVSIWEI